MALRKGKDPKIELLQGVPLFAGLDHKELEQVARHGDEVRVEAGKVIVSQDESAHSFYVIIEGAAEVRRDGKKLAVLGPGDFLGEMALLEDLRRSATVTTTVPTRLLEMHRRDFSGLLDDAPHLARKMLATLASRLRAADQMIVT